MALNNPYALSFDGDDSVSVSSLPSAVDELTVECWIYVNEFNKLEAGYTSTPIISDFNTWPSAAPKGYFLGVSYELDSLLWVFAVCDGANDRYIMFDELPYDEFTSKYANKWLHIALVFKSGEYIKLLINGEVKSSLETDIPLQMQPDIATPTYFGYSEIDASYLDGKIDEVRIWSVARTETQINDNKNVKLKGNEIGLVSYWRLDEGTGTTAGDSASSNNGTITGASWVTGEIPLTMPSEIKFEKYGDIYYTDEIDFSEDIEAGIIAFTSDVNLIGTRINQVSARHVKPEIILIRSRK